MKPITAATFMLGVLSVAFAAGVPACKLIVENHDLEFSSRQNQKMASVACRGSVVSGDLITQALINVRNELPRDRTADFVDAVEYRVLATGKNPEGLSFCFNNDQPDRTVKYDGMKKAVVFGSFTDKDTQVQAVEAAVRAVYEQRTPAL